MKTLLLTLVAVVGLSATANAQQTFFKVRIDNVAEAFAYPSSAVFNTPVGATDPAPIGPGGAYEFTFDAPPGTSLSFTTMFVPSNDLFFAPDENGIALWNSDGTQVSGDVTAQVQLWDAGSEANEEPGVGPNQVQRQSGPNTGPADPDSTVRLVNDGFTYPAVADVIQVTITPVSDTRFTARIENVSTETTLTPSDGSMQAVPLSPGVWVVHTTPGPLFTVGQADRAEGLEAIAEDGSPGGLGGVLAEATGVNHVLSPGVWAVHTDTAPLFTSGEMDRGQGLESIAEDGNPGMLANILALETMTTGGAFAVPEGSDGPGPIGPGGAYEFTIAAMPGAFLTVATMFVQSNDLLFAPDEMGIALWNDDGNPISGDVTAQLDLWDAGTEVNETPGFGLNQAPRQMAANTGADEDGDVVLIADGQPGPAGFTYPNVADVIRLTVTPLPTASFTVRVENVSTGTTLTPSDGSMQAVPLSPGVWVVHADPAPLFTSGEAERGRGLAAIAEDGNPALLNDAIAAKIGFGGAVFNTPVGATDPAPIGPGGAYEFTFDAAPGARLSLATMFVPSNDLFFGPDENGIALWDENGIPVSGDVTAQVQLWDAGSEANEEPGVGPNQVQRQSGPDTGPADPDSTVRLVNDGFTYPAVAEVIRVTIDAVATAVEERDPVPNRFTLHQNYPNPFNPETTIAFDLEQAGPVQLTVYNVLGQQVARLVDGFRSAGTHQARWDGRDNQGFRAATGVYLYKLDVGGSTAVRKMVLLQ